MNFVDHQHDIETLLLLPDRRESKTGPKKQYFKGVYIFSRDVNDTTYKIGVAYGKGGLFQRLKNYKICYPYEDEFFLQYILISPTAFDAKILEKIILTAKRLKSVAENKAAVGRRSLEWKMVTKRQTLNDIIISKLNENPNLWTHLIIFGETGWTIHKNDGQLNKTLSRPSKSRATKMGLFEQKVQTQTFEINGDEKIGDIIDTPWGDATVVKLHKNKDLELKWKKFSGTYRVKPMG